jgi:nucleoside-diphosphate-sugar epimerase
MSQRILLTGANGFIGAHILSLLLTNGYSVRAILRSQSKADQVLADFPTYASKLDFGIVPDITAPGAFDTAVRSDPPFNAAIHTASPFLCKLLQNKRKEEY